MSTDEELEHLSALADAKLGVAEELVWIVVILVWVAVHLKWDNWLLAAAASVAAYFLVVNPYRRVAAKAEDAYFRQARLGKYAGTRGATDV
jgi:uncharacterized ion transporter superfamily protein YfcC